MSIVCKNCGAEFEAGKFCPKCGTPVEAPVQQPMEAVQPEAQQNTYQPPVQPEQPTYQPPVQPEPQQVAYQQPVQQMPQQTAYQQPAPQYGYQQPVAVAPKEPSKIGLAFSQGFKVLKNFFSKNTAEVVSAQHNEKLPVWILMTLIPAVVAALSGWVCHSSHASLMMMFTKNDFIYMYGEDWLFMLASLLYAVGFVFAFALAVFLFGKVIKKQEVSFTGCLNLTSTALLPTAIGSLGMILLSKVFEISSTEFIIMTIAFSMLLLYIGVKEMFGGISVWQFFFMTIVATAIFVLVAYILSMVFDSIAKGQKPEIVPNNSSMYDMFGDMDDYGSIFDSLY